MNNINLEEELVKVQTKLSYLRERYKEGSPAMKKYIHSSAIIWKEREASLKRKLDI